MLVEYLLTCPGRHLTRTGDLVLVGWFVSQTATRITIYQFNTCCVVDVDVAVDVEVAAEVADEVVVVVVVVVVVFVIVSLCC